MDAVKTEGCWISHFIQRGSDILKSSPRLRLVSIWYQIWERIQSGQRFPRKPIGFLSTSRIRMTLSP